MKIYSQCLQLKFSFNIVCTKGNNGAVAVLVDVDDFTQPEFEEHAAITELVSVQTAFLLLKQQPGCGCPNGE